MTAEQRKKQANKLSTRIEKVSAYESQEERKIIGIPFNESLAKKHVKAAKPEPVKKAEPAPIPKVIKHQDAPKRRKIPDDQPKPKKERRIFDDSEEHDWGSHPNDLF